MSDRAGGYVLLAVLLAVAAALGFGAAVAFDAWLIVHLMGLAAECI